MYIKGTASGKLSLYPGSGLCFVISNDDALEKHIISSYIYDYSQTYKTNTRWFIPGSGKHVLDLALKTVPAPVIHTIIKKMGLR